MTTVDASGAIHGNDGRFAGHIAGEPDDGLELAQPGATGDDLPNDPDIRARDAATQRRLRQVTIEPGTGGCPPVMVGDVDIANTYIGNMPLRARAYLALYAEHIEQNPGHQVPESLRDALTASREKALAARELHEQFGGNVSVEDEHFGSDPRNTQRVTSWTNADGELGVAAREWDAASFRYEDAHGTPVEFTETQDFDAHDGMGPAVEKRFVSATRLPDGELLRPQRAEWGDGDYRLHFERQLPDGGAHTWSADPDDQSEAYHDKIGLVHRDDGPAMIDERCIEYRRHGITHRDRNQGPAVIGSDGKAHFIENGCNVDDQIFPGQARAAGLEPDPAGGWRVPGAGPRFNPADAYYEGRFDGEPA
ncbi:hypothetical protein [Branchiibius cervicis]|uniref:Uncharacterized protein n=1 Tax=Branchiibius cervicis TaxID=908252 RepID=A0ABW2AV57_9MICO